MDPFTITTTGGAFAVLAVDPKGPPATNVKIVVPNSGLNLTNLPGCSIFPITAPAGSTFTLTVNGATTFAAHLVIHQLHRTRSRRTCSESPGPRLRLQLHVPRVTPVPCPVYTCPPRQACSLTRLFTRRSLRSCCW